MDASSKKLLDEEDLEGYGSTTTGINASSENVELQNATASIKFESSLYFEANKNKKIDFVLVWEEEIAEKESDDTQMKKSARAKKKRKRRMQLQHSKWRKMFLKMLDKEVEIEEHTVENGASNTHYILIHCPWKTLCFYAESLGFRVPIQAQPNRWSNWSADQLARFKIPNMLDQDVPNSPAYFYTCAFKNGKLERFLGSDNRATFFNDTQRQRVAWEILSTTCFGSKEKAEIGIERLINESVFSAAYPLHCGECDSFDDDSEERLNTRQILRKYWARWGSWYKYQPLDHIRQYFGEKIALYFAWLGFYTAWLLPASIVGIIIFLVGFMNLNDNIKYKQVCESNQTFLMCPDCDEEICKYWEMRDKCLYIYVAYLFDHAGTVFFAIFTSFWAVFFLEFWKRSNAVLTHRWDCFEFEEEEESIRPQYAALAPSVKRNEITDALEPHFPETERKLRVVSGIAAIILMGVVVMIFIIAVILYRVLIQIPLHDISTFKDKAPIVASITAAAVNLVLIMSLGKMWEVLAEKLTQYEMHRTESDYEDALILKVFLFQFVNFYASIIYVGFFKGRFVGYPGHYSKFFGLRQEECSNGSCLMELAIQLAVIMIGKQTINNLQEIFIPLIKTILHRSKTINKHKGNRISAIIASFKPPKREEIDDAPQWQKDYLLIENEGLFGEYLEMVLQFGFITIFVAAFPLAPLFALVNNWFEIRIDSQKFVTETRRPVAERAQDIGQWYNILELLSRLAVLSNAFLIAFTSDFIPKTVYRYTYGSFDGYIEHSLSEAPPNTTSHACLYQAYREPDGTPNTFHFTVLVARLLFVIVFEHVVFVVQFLIDFVIPDVPEDLHLKMRREKYLAKQALADTAEEVQDV